MKKTFKVVASLLLVLVTSTFVFAQTSGTFQGTAGTLRDDADYFMDVRYFNEVDFSNFFSMINLSSTSANLGFAKEFDDVYIGAYYSGALWNGFNSTKTVNDMTTNVTNNFTGNHQFDLLLGISGIAIKFDSIFNVDNENTKESDAETNDREEGKTNSSNYIFGLTFAVDSVPMEYGNVIPWGRIGFDLNDNTEETIEVYDGTTYRETNKSANENKLLVTLAADFENGDRESFFSVAGIKYTLETLIGANGVIVEATDGSETSTMSRYDKLGVTNNFDLNYRFEYKASDNLKFGGRIGAEIDIYTSCAGDTYYDDDKPESTDKLPQTTETNISSNLGLGMQYKIKPNFAMNVGLGATLPKFESTKNVIYAGDTTSTTVISNVNTAFSSTLSAGFVWDINENCALDAYMNIGRTPKFLSSILDGSLTLGFKYKM